jgi:hypothetical protein
MPEDLHQREQVGLVEFTGMDQAHEQIATRGPFIVLA